MAVVRFQSRQPTASLVITSLGPWTGKAATGRPVLLSVPSQVLRAGLGEMGVSLLLASQRVVPKRLTEMGFTFEDSEIQAALTDLLSAKRGQLMEQIQTEVTTNAKSLGINIADIRIGRTDLRCH